ncbi:hypothetical protein A1A1_04887 [Planococcus antarcticus DSM 14505]|uniref:Sulfurtransferase n=1 Tax=Planococcus antarcticus DSM 14505 TaxID=1185653 RepID=A0A1C7DF76_9BACL|nr:hypothetical protein [Planococcus antarcticus]ANU09873.1 hypothetical protein BBH88_05955 [Planococcus antarcticus DSM 14505]EIM07517.1 hypothetical protein A1A1_04887 [Planococcus antarcticus DSM 14505]
MIVSTMLIGLPVSMAAYSVYKRHMPVHGIKQARLDQIDSDFYALLDVRAYNVSDKEFVSEAFNLPISYFTRGYKEIPRNPIHLIAENQMEKNLAVRLLQQKGFNVASYSLIGKNKMQTSCF